MHEVERGSFTPLVFSSSGGMGNLVTCNLSYVIFITFQLKSNITTVPLNYNFILTLVPRENYRASRHVLACATFPRSEEYTRLV